MATVSDSITQASLHHSHFTPQNTWQQHRNHIRHLEWEIFIPTKNMHSRKAYTTHFVPTSSGPFSTLTFTHPICATCAPMLPMLPPKVKDLSFTIPILILPVLPILPMSLILALTILCSPHITHSFTLQDTWLCPSPYLDNRRYNVSYFHLILYPLLQLVSCILPLIIHCFTYIPYYPYYLWPSDHHVCYPLTYLAFPSLHQLYPYHRRSPSKLQQPLLQFGLELWLESRLWWDYAFVRIISWFKDRVKGSGFRLGCGGWRQARILL